MRKTVYGLKDAAKHWYESLMEVLKETGGRGSTVDGTLITWKSENGLYGIMCTHMDDLCFKGTDIFHKQEISWIKEKLKVVAEENTRFKYLGMNVVEEEEGWIILDQNIREKLRIPLVLREKYKRELSIGEQRNYRSILDQLSTCG